jgi:hypothetical protein
LSFTAQGKLREESPYLPKQMPRPFAALRVTLAATLDSQFESTVGFSVTRTHGWKTTNRGCPLLWLRADNATRIL